jgi:hypothetical protein
MATRTQPLRSTAGRNARRRAPLDSDQVRRAEAFSRRVMNGTSNIVARDYLPPPVAHHSGPRYWSLRTFVDDDLEYTVQVLVTRRRGSTSPELLP